MRLEFVVRANINTSAVFALGADANGDGQITRGELTAAMSRMMRSFGGPGGAGGRPGSEGGPPR